MSVNVTNIWEGGILEIEVSLQRSLIQYLERPVNPGVLLQILTAQLSTVVSSDRSSLIFATGESHQWPRQGPSSQLLLLRRVR